MMKIISEGLLDDLGDLRLFERIATAGSLSAVARDMGCSLAVVSKRLARLEQRLHVRLFNRSTRRISLTEEGLLLRAQALRVLAVADDAEAELLGRQARVAGTLRLSAPNSLGRRHLVPILAAFSAAHPDLSVNLSLSDAVADLVEGGFDLAIRFGTLADSRLVARELAPNRRVLVAAPAYIARRGMPSTLDDLSTHDCLVIGSSLTGEWRFAKKTVRVQGRFVSDDGEAIHALALEGAGIALKTLWDVNDDLRQGHLVQVLPGHAIAAAPLHAVYLQVPHLAPRVRLFVEFAAMRLQQMWARQTSPVA